MSKKTKKLEKKRLKKYKKFLKDNHDWDYAYIIDLLRFKIKMTRKQILKNDSIEEETMKEIVDQMKETETLLNRVISNEHFEQLEQEFKEKFGGKVKTKMKFTKKNQVKFKDNFSKINEDMIEEAKEEFLKLHDKEDELKKEDLKKAFEIMSENIWNWWD